MNRCAGARAREGAYPYAAPNWKVEHVKQCLKFQKRLLQYAASFRIDLSEAKTTTTSLPSPAGRARKSERIARPLAVAPERAH
eukprot:1958766-Pyramimonas_sp.AAC.1